jgi:hypothetical protein
MSQIRDSLWLWGHDAGSHNDGWDLPAASRMTPLEAACYLGIPNLIMVGYEGRPQPPLDQYQLALQPLTQVVWSVVGAGGETAAAERTHVLELAQRFPNITGVIMDDFFRSQSTDADDAGVLSVPELQSLRGELGDLALWVVLYDHQLDAPVSDHLALCDRVTFWTWEARNLDALQRNLDRVEQLAPDAERVLGCYMWDYGQKRPIPLASMQRQCELGLDWLRQGRIDGMIFLASCISDLGLDTVEWTREWIERVGAEEA